MENKLFVGFGQTCITPKDSVPLSGYGNSGSRMSANVLSDLYATGIAVTDAEGSTVLLIETDLIAVYAGTMDPIRRAMALLQPGVFAAFSKISAASFAMETTLYITRS